MKQFWIRKLRTVCTAFTVCALLAATAQTSHAAQPAADAISGWNFDIGPSKGQVIGVVAGIAAVGAGVGIGIYYGTHHNHTLRGCVASGPDGLVLVNEGDQQNYSLVGVVTPNMAGERIRVSGKKSKKGAAVPNQFLVEKVTKDYGSCKLQPAGH